MIYRFSVKMQKIGSHGYMVGVEVFVLDEVGSIVSFVVAVCFMLLLSKTPCRHVKDLAGT